MSLQFVFGNSGSGKSYYLHKKIVEESIKNPGRNYLVLVPEQFTMQTQKDLVLAHPNKGIMNIDVLSFGRLSHRIFEEVGGMRGTVLDDEGKNLILRKVAGDYEEELAVLRGNLKKQGYISEVKSVISEFTQYGIGLEELDDMLEEMEPESYLYYKLRDIRNIYERFYAYLEEKYITKEELLAVLGDVVGQSDILKDSVVALDGFTGFTPVQNKLLGELLKLCSKVIVTAEMDQREDPFVYHHPYQLFALSKHMITSLMEIAKTTGAKIEEPVCLYKKPVHRFKENEAMGFLESELFRYFQNTYHKEQEAIQIHCTRNPKEEADFVAAQIRKLVRTKKYRYRDIAVIASDMTVYADYLEKAFSQYDIPVFMDHKRSILLNSFVEYVRSLLVMAEQNFTYESVFRFLRTGHTGFTQEEIDEMENYVIALGIRGYKKWRETWVRRSKGMDEGQLTGVDMLRAQFVEKTHSMLSILKKRKKTVREITVAVYEFLVQERLQEQLAEMELAFQEAGELALAKEYAQVYRIVIELFDKFVSLLGDEAVSLREYCQLLDAGLEEAKVGVIPPSIDQVMVGDMERTRLKDIKALFLVGANDTLIPGKMGQGGLLSERDRERLKEKKVTLSPGAKEKNYIQKFYLYMNLTKPTKYLFLSYSKVSSDGKSLRPAYLIKDIQRLYPQLAVVDEEQKAFYEKEMIPETGISYLIKGLHEGRETMGDSWKELYSWYQNHPVFCARVERIVKAAFYRKEKDALSAKTAERLYGDNARLSATRMEQFAACAYAHFLKYGLRLSDREEYNFQAVDLGNIAHSSMERFAKKAKERKLQWTRITDKEREQLIEQSVEESIADYGNTVLYSSARNEYMITRIKRIMHRTVWALTKQLERGDFEPSEYELSFGSGKIDRIDICEDADTVYVKVLDYKTGTKAFDMTALYHGLQMQLVVYLNAALETEERKHAGKEVAPAGIFYYRIQDPLVDKTADDEVLEQQLLKKLKLDGIVNADEKVIQHLDRDISGSSDVIPVGRNKDHSLSRNSKVLTKEGFETISEYTRQMIGRMETEIRSGKAEAAPYELGGKSGCDYCGYRDICGFDGRLDGYEYRRLPKYDTEEVLKNMESQMDEQKEEEV